MLDALWALAAASAICTPPGRAIVAEVYYDAIGDDTGHEFVELFNPSGGPVALNGARLEVGDGAGPGRWTLRWTGGIADTVAPGARFVIGGARVTPAPRALAPLDLQNGPDAVRVVWPDGATEVVGYGALVSPEYFCGEAAADVASGFSLARVPDDADHGRNAADFRAATPSPGRPNQPRRNLALIGGALAITPESPAPAAEIRLAGSLANLGADTIGVGELSLTVAAGSLEEAGAASKLGRGGPPRWVERSSATPPELGPLVLLPGDTLGYELGLAPLPAGKYRLRAQVAMPGDENPNDDRDSLDVRVGLGPLGVTEIQFHPLDGEGEWVEVRNLLGEPVALESFTLSDRGSARGIPRDGSGPLVPESLAVLAQDRAALLALHPELDAARVWQVSPWSALNNSDDTTGVADQVVVREADGVLVARVPYRAHGVPAGVPLEWRDGVWQPALDPRGTPLSLPRAPPPAIREFDVTPSRVPSGGARLSLEWALPWPRARVRVDLYDLEGRRVGEIVPETSTSGRGSREIALAGVAPGVYWLVLEARGDAGARLHRVRPLRIARGG